MHHFLVELNLFFIIFLHYYTEKSRKVSNKLRKEVAGLYLLKHKNIVLWGTDLNTTAEKFDALYTDMSWVKVKRGAKDIEQQNLKHYLDMLVTK